jgi:biotin transport system substrate-specific component
VGAEPLSHPWGRAGWNLHRASGEDIIEDTQEAVLREKMGVPSSGSVRAAWPRRLAVALVGALAVAISARVAATLPGSSVPQSAQTLAVLLVGAVLGARDGALTLTAYLVLGALGLPVFADGASGAAHLVGPTAGYLLGFLVAASGVGWAGDRDLLRGFGPALAAMVAGHAVILLLGWSWLALTLGPSGAFAQGVAPFVWGGMVKSFLAAGVVVGAGHLASR